MIRKGSSILLLLAYLTTAITVVAEEAACQKSNDETCSTADNAVACSDSDPDCPNWARDGECDFNPEFMLKSCVRACGACDLDATAIEKLIERKTRITEAGGNEKFLETPYGMSQFIFDYMEDHVTGLFRNMTTYMEEIVMKDPRYQSVRDRCKNKHRECAQWKLSGQCEQNVLWMQSNCAPVCEACLSLDYDHRCPSIPDYSTSTTNALRPGGLNALFERMIKHEFHQKYKPKALSMPHNSTVKQDDAVDGPWVVVLENFLTDEECDRLIQLGTEKGYELSTSLRNGVEHQKRVSSLRTSTNTWCDKSCLDDEVTKRVQAKIENITDIPERNAENLQLLRYEPGQQCFVHNDYLDYHKDRQMGARILTVFLYLSDVKEGGGTHFPDLSGVVVQPKKGRAVVWPSVLNEKPHEEDPRSIHGSFPIVSGIKYGANAFIHQRDAKVAYERGCF